MSVSISAICKSEEIEKWPQQVNNGEGNSPMLSRRGELMKGMQNFYITLAKESPTRIYEESDASTYDIDFHCMETDLCRDSSDTDANSSFTFDGIATMEVLEYEVRSSSSTENLYSNNSSSGSDEDFLLAAVAARAMCDTSTSYSSAFADTEDSDSESTCDSELSAADYWVCVKCKNKQNNPMFRYCEKCYQIRKNHFPPRPKQWKSRTKKGRKKGFENSCRGKVASTCKNGSLDKNVNIAERLGKFDSISKNQVTSKFYNCTRKYKNINCKSQLNSAAETSSEEEDISDRYTRKLNTSKRKNRSSSEMKVEKLSTNATSSKNITLSTNLSNSLECSKNRKRKHEETAEMQPLKKINTSGNPVDFADVIESDSETDTTSNNTQLQKDSGISSAPPSSQEVPSSSLSDDHQNPEKLKGGNDSSDDTVCEELDAKDIAELKNLKTSHEVSKVSELGRHTSDISSLQTASSMETQKTPLMKSISACTEEIELFSRNINKSQSFADNLEYSAYGQCIACLSEPKNGVFVHSKFVHLCCCYKCAVKIWNKSKRCPVCNCAVKNVMKLFVH